MKSGRVGGGSKKSRTHRPPGSVPFPQVKGKRLADVYLTTQAEMNSVVLCFDDNTDLVVDIEPCVAFTAQYSEWKAGNQRVIKSWRRVRGG